MTTLPLIDDDPAIHEAVERPLADAIELFLHETAPDDGLRLALAERTRSHRGERDSR